MQSILVLPRWRNKAMVVLQSVKAASIHSTAVSSDRRRQNNNNKKHKNHSDGESTQRPSKNCIRFEIRQKRADAKKALKGLLFGDRFEEYIPNTNGKSCFSEGNVEKKSRLKSSPRQAYKAHHKRIKRKLRREVYSDDECPELFHATFGNKSYTWSFKSWEETKSRNSSNDFHWKEYSNWADDRYSKWQNPSDIESSDDESCSVGSSSDRRLLGLPSEGPLKIEDVKNAFRLSALKWHPDKHQGPSQETAEEKFKLCVTAYKSLCGALSST